MRYISYREREKRNRNKLAFIPLLFASVILVSGTYAWFTYYSDVDGKMTGHVVGWNINFDDGDSLSEDFSVTVAKIFPGMEEFSTDLTITNNGETSAEISSVLKSITVLGTKYQVGATYEGQILTSAKIIEILEDKYPFKFGFNVKNNVITPGTNTKFVVDLHWDFETYKKVNPDDYYSEVRDYYVYENDKYVPIEILDADTYNNKKSTLYFANDVEDTKWGEAAYEFMEENPDEPCVSLTLQVNAVQHLEKENG